MAASTAFRPQLLRQAFAAPTQRCLSTTSSIPAFRAAQITKAQPLRATPSSIRVAAFHASQPRAILPPLPQVIRGTVNDAANTPDPAPAHGSFHWSFERAMSAALVPLTIAPFAAGSLNPVMDAIFAATILIHSHIGFESCIIDYFPRWRVPGVRKALMWVLRAATVLVGVGLYEFETNDVGITEAVKRIWRA